MKKVKQISCLLLTLICLAVSAFSVYAADDVEAQTLDALKNVAASIAQECMSMTDPAELEVQAMMSEQQGDHISAQAMAQWAQMCGETGKFVEIQDITATHNKGWQANAVVQCENKKVNFGISFNEQLDALTSITFDVEKTFGEKMKNAALNLVLGMGTVFIVLIFLMYIISAFKYVPALMDKFTAKKKTEQTAAPAPAPVAAPVVPVEEVPAQDDAQLVAVIAAAIAAYEGTSAEGLVVRSIRRVGKSNWKR